jgi:hypothetical protein
MRALRVALRSIAAGLALASLAAAPSQRVTLTLTDRDGAPLGDSLAVWNGTRANPGGSNTIIRVVISPAPVVAPPVTFVSDNDAVGVGPDQSMPFDTGIPLAAALYVRRTAGGATVTAHIGPPYDASLHVRVAAYGNTNLACAIGAWPAWAFAADGTVLPAQTIADADVYLTVAGDPQRSSCRPFTLADQTAREVYHFPYGAVRVGAADTFEAVRAAWWRDDVHETAAGAASGLHARKAEPRSSSPFRMARWQWHRPALTSRRSARRRFSASPRRSRRSRRLSSRPRSSPVTASCGYPPARR